MLKTLLIAGALLALLSSAAAVAFAADAAITLTTCADCRAVVASAAPGGDLVQVLPWFTMVAPVVAQVMAVVAGLLVTAIGGYAVVKFHLNVTSDQIARASAAVQSAVADGAGSILAAQAGPVASLAFHVGSPLVAVTAASIAARLPGQLEKLGITPQVAGAAVSTMILGQIGRLQIQAPAAAAVVPVLASPASAPQ